MAYYWLGVITTPTLVAAAIALFVLWVRVTDVLAGRGITFEAKWSRDVDDISDFMLEQDIWWERAYGPIFVGHWHRDLSAHPAPTEARINRWVGIGSRHGPAVMVFHSRTYPLPEGD